jgi:hypothetical protein
LRVVPIAAYPISTWLWQALAPVTAGVGAALDGLQDSAGVESRGIQVRPAAKLTNQSMACSGTWVPALATVNS